MTDSVLPISTEIASDKSRKRSGGCRSEWWEHFSEVIVNGMKIAQCKYCSSRYAKNGTGNMKTHMLTKHSNKMAASNQPTVDPTNVATPDAKFDNERSMQLLIRFVVSNNHPFSMIEESSFKDLIESLQPNMKLTSSASLKARIIASEWKMKAALINYLQNRNIGTPSASVDLHIAKDVSIMAVTVTWVDEKFIRREIVVGFRQIIGDRCAVNLSRMLLEVLEDFSIRKVLCITAVDANSNGTLVDELVRQTVNFDVAFVKDHWISCLVNIVHLAAQEALDRIDPLVSKLRLLAKIIDESPRRRQKLKSALLQSGTDSDREKILAPDVLKRWMSALSLVERALEMRQQLDAMTRLDRKLRDVELTDDDWTELADIGQFLEPFASVSKELEGSQRPTLNVATPLFNALIDHVNDWLDETSSANRSAGIVSAAEAAKTKLTEHYYKTAEIHVVPVVLDPRLKMDYFSVEGWGPLIETQVKPALMRVWDRYRPSTAHVSPPATDSKFNSMVTRVHERVKQKQTKLDELESYLLIGPEEVSDVLTYWKASSNKWPHVASMARDYLAPSASSVASERSWSVSSLVPETMEVTMRLRSWFRSGLNFLK